MSTSLTHVSSCSTAWNEREKRIGEQNSDEAADPVSLFDPLFSSFLLQPQANFTGRRRKRTAMSSKNKKRQWGQDVTMSHLLPEKQPVSSFDATER